LDQKVFCHHVDCRCFNCPFDDLSQIRVRLEAEAVEWILEEFRIRTIQLGKIQPIHFMTKSLPPTWMTGGLP
jgi:hypothetical protein